GGATTTTSIPSSNAATTVVHSGPGHGTRASRSSATPASAAARSPRSGMPTTALQAPLADASASSASSTLVPPRTATLPPRRSPGSNGRSCGATGSSRSALAPAVAAARSLARRTPAAPAVSRNAVAGMVPLPVPRAARPGSGRGGNRRGLAGEAERHLHHRDELLRGAQQVVG